MEMAEGAIPINNLPVNKLQEILGQLEQRCESLANAIAQLNGANQQYDEMRSALDHVQKESEGKEMFVPLSPSLYAMGEMEETEKVIVDIGTGYYVEKSVADAKVFVERKKEYLKKQITDLEAQLDTQTRNVEQVSLVLQSKIPRK